LHRQQLGSAFPLGRFRLPLRDHTFKTKITLLPERCRKYFGGLVNAIKFPRFSCLKGLGSPNALKSLKSEYSQVQRETPASHNDPTAKPGDQLSARNEGACSFHGEKICRPRALPSVRLLAVTAALGVALALLWRSTGTLPGQFWPAAPEPAPQSASNPTAGGAGFTARARLGGAQKKHHRACQCAAAVECQHRGTAGGPAGTSATGDCRLFLLVFRAGLEIRRCDPPRSLGIATANGRRPGGRQGSRRPKTRGEPSPAAGGAAAVTPFRCGGCAVLAPPGSQPGPPPPFP
jgi:hypothetical protein